MRLMEPPPLAAPVLPPECLCLIWAYAEGEHPHGAHSVIQVINACPQHRRFFADADPEVRRWAEVEVEAAVLRAVVTDHPERWRAILAERLNPVPGKGRTITLDEFRDRQAAYEKAERKRRRRLERAMGLPPLPGYDLEDDDRW